MSIRLTHTFVCDNCETEFMMTDEAEMPRHWLGFQMVVANSDGLIPKRERDLYSHFCSLRCLIEYVSSSIVRERVATVDMEEDDDDVMPEDGDEQEAI